MRLCRLHIKNFRVIREARLELADSLIGLIGPNGAGKSSIIEAIAWALYGNSAARSSREEIKTQNAGPSESCAVELDFELHGQVHRVVRRLVGKTGRPEAQLDTAGQTAAVGIRDSQEAIRSLVGLDFRGFLTSFLARQQELNALTDLTPVQRRTHLAGMLGVERIDRAIQAVKADNKTAGQQTAFLERQLLGVDQHRTRMEEISSQLTALRRRHPEAEAAANVAGERLEKAEEDLKNGRDQQHEHLRLQAGLETARADRGRLVNQIEQLRTQAAELDRLEARGGSLEEALSNYGIVRNSLAEMERASAQVVARKGLEKQLTRVAADLAKTEKAREVCRSELMAAEKELADLPKSLDEAVAAAEADLERQREAYSALAAEHHAAKIALEKVRRQLNDIEKFGPESVCDRCHRPLGSDLETIRGHMQAEEKDLDNELKRLSAGLDEARRRGQEQAARHEGLRTKRERRNEVEALRIALTQRREELDSSAAEQEKSRSAVEAELVQISAVEVDERELTRLREQLARMDQMRSELDQLRGRLQRRPEITSALATAGSDLDETVKGFTALEAETARLGFDADKLQTAEAALTTAQQQRDTSRGELTALEKEIELKQQEITSLKERLDQIAAWQDELETVRDSHHYGEALARLLAGYREELVTSIRPTLADLSSRLMDRASGGRYSLVELDDKYNLRLLDNGQFFGIERFSGGEKDLANLCLRLAISQALTQSAGMDRSMVILDEVFGSQDDNRKDLIISALGGLRHLFPQIILVTHVEEIKDRVEQIIRVEPTGHGYSEVSLNESVV